MSRFCQKTFLIFEPAQSWRTLVAGDEQPYKPRSRST